MLLTLPLRPATFLVISLSTFCTAYSETLKTVEEDPFSEIEAGFEVVISFLVVTKVLEEISFALSRINSASFVGLNCAERVVKSIIYSMEEEVLMTENGNLELHDDESVQINGVLKENENPDVDILEDLDAYWNELNDRLTISRVVSDSIVRGMVTAIESEAAEMIAQKDLELSRMKETLLLYHVGSEENEASETRLMHNKVDFGNTDVFPEHGRTQESLSSLKSEARKQLLMLVQELTNLRRHIHTNGVGTLGLGSNSQENGSKTVDKMLDSLRSILETVLKRKSETEPPSSWQQEHEFKTDIEFVVLTSFVRSLKDEYEQRLWKQEAEFGDRRSLLCEKIKEITSLRQELMFISKTLSDHENGEIETGTVGNRKKTESLHRKISGSLSLETNGKHEECFVGSVPENIEALNHLSRDDLINHFNTVINKMKRDHDYEVQGMTEQYFTLRREYLNLQERGSFSHVKKDKELVALKMKIPRVISKLDKILLEDEKLVSAGKNNTDFKSQLDSLLVENRKLKDSLSDAAEKISQLSQIEADHQKLIQKLESDVEDSNVEATISEDVYHCVVMEFVSQVKSAKQKTDLELSEMREAYELKESCKSRDDLEDFCVESLTKDCCVVIYKEVLKEADKKIEELNIHVSEKERALRSEMLENETLKKDIDLLNCLVKEKEELVQTIENNLVKETEKFEIVSKQNNDLQCQIDQQKTEIQDKNEALGVVSSHEQEKLEGYEKKLHDLRRELALARENLKKTKDEKKITEEKLIVTKAAEEKLKEQLLSLDIVPSKLIKGFDMLERLVAEKTQETQSRLKDMERQLSVLSHQMYEVKEKAMTYKQRLEKKCCDLQKAEAEVDVLGDEVESFLDLLEKIYIALDHYSPILKHYPGIIEILKLVRRELSGERKRSSV